MPKQLLVMRHAKSSWSHPNIEDHDRPLNQRGRRAAPQMGRWLIDQDLEPDLIISSTANRARSTAELIVQTTDLDVMVECKADLYHATAAEIVDVVQSVDDSIQRLLLIGHNPGLESIIHVLSGEHETMPTAAIALLDLDIDHWANLPCRASGQLHGCWRPKELDGS